MQLESLQVNRIEYGIEKGQFKAIIRVKAGDTRTELILTETQAARIVNVVAEEIQTSVQVIAESILDTFPLLANEE